MKKFLVFLCSIALLVGLVGAVNATPIYLTPVVDRSAERHNSDPWELRDENSLELEVSAFENVGVIEVRSALEFDISPIPNLPIAQVTLMLSKVDFTDLMIQIDGYTGDGTIETDDFDESGFLTQHDPGFGLNVIDLGQEGIDFIEELVSRREMHAGILLSEIGFSSNLFLSREAIPSEGQTVPTLCIQPVPEPATLLLLGSGLIGLVAFRKKFRKS